MSRKTIWIAGIVFVAATLLLTNVFHTAIGGYMMTVSITAAGVAIAVALYLVLSQSIKQFVHRRND
ncbi:MULTISPECIES: hypothetical protein [Sporosarcina]|uniref:hypothetical protein n=1 Tax=Sporosarcina TaxID=1569 RepID=UPI0005905C0A|nr:MULTISPECIES: hypothetical protein [Sporosarcina]WJY27535.1 hypothetical protein QWT68_00490 [Sporosarcina sp. 0.2-SM1T-5]